MGTIHVVSGVGTAPTAKAAYDTALADANLHNYNLVPVSSVVPADAEVVEVDSAPDLGPAGNRLHVVEACVGTVGPGRIAAGLAWATGPGPGLFYEAAVSDETTASGTASRAADAESEAEVRTLLETGLEAGRGLRDWTFEDESLRIETTEAAPGEHTCVVVLAAYGESEPIL